MSTTVLPDFSACSPRANPEKAKEMLTVSESGGVTHVRINSSSLGIILSCMRKAHYSLERGLRSQLESPALVYGTAIHKALEVFYSHPCRERSIPTAFVENSDLMAHGHAAPDAHFLYQSVAAFVAEMGALRGLADTDKRSIPTGIWLLQNYFRTYINDPYEVFVDAAGPVTERTCSMLLHAEPGLQIELFGTIDVVLQNKATGQVLPADHKTTSVIGSEFFNRLKPNHQYTGYLLLAQTVLGLTTNEFLVNGIQVKARPITARGQGPHFTRQPTTRSEHDITEFRESVVHAVKNYLQARATGRWPLGHVDSCTMWGGCGYLEICSAPSQLRENMIEAKFITNRSPNASIE